MRHRWARFARWRTSCGDRGSARSPHRPDYSKSPSETPARAAEPVSRAPAPGWDDGNPPRPPSAWIMTRHATPAPNPVLAMGHFKRATGSFFPSTEALRVILEIAFAHIHSRFRTYNDLCSRLRSWRPERQQSFHCRPTALRCRPISLAPRRRTAAPPRISRQSRHTRRRVDHHLPRAPDAGGQSSRGPSATERTDRPRASRAENPPPQSTHARLQGPSAHGKIGAILLQETAWPDKRRLRWLIRPRDALVRMSAKAAADARSGDADCLESEFRKMTPGRSHYRSASQQAWIGRRSGGDPF
jgi:hypothetical protein